MIIDSSFWGWYRVGQYAKAGVPAIAALSAAITALVKDPSNPDLRYSAATAALGFLVYLIPNAAAKIKEIPNPAPLLPPVERADVSRVAVAYSAHAAHLAHLRQLLTTYKPGQRGQWRGVTLDPRTRDMVTEADHRMPTIPMHPTQGSYSNAVAASAGTHGGGGAIDFSCRGLTAGQVAALIVGLESVGFAPWHRLPSQGPWGEHVHAIAIGCEDLAPAAVHQVEDYLAGRNGLASHSKDSRSHKPTTWETYLKG